MLANVCRVPLEKIFGLFDASLDPSEQGSADVKYHAGVSVSRVNRKNNKQVKISLLSNPSHLEAVDPVVLGMPSHNF